MAWLARHGDIEDPSGMASTTLARSVGYPGSSIAFAQLLSGMERSGLIIRDVRGKRTYRVGLTDAGRERANAGRTRPNSGRDTTRHAVAARRYAETPSAIGNGERSRRSRSEENEVDYDELARRLLLQVARRLAEGHVDTGSGDARAPDGTEVPASGDAGAATLAGSEQVGHDVAALAQRLADLEAELSRARVTRLLLQEENEALRDQIDRIRQNLETSRQAPIRTQAPPAAVDEIDHHDLALLQQMLVASEDGDRRRGDEADSA